LQPNQQVKSFFIPRLFSFFAPILLSGLVSAQVLTHGPVVGGVTSSEARVFVRTNVAANVALCYGTDPNLYACQVSQSFQTKSAHDFTRIIPLSGLSPESRVYLNVVVNGVPQFPYPPYPSFATFPPDG
jgi:phosphodiesterase/alkaline phosphatase D-like protein